MSTAARPEGELDALRDQVDRVLEGVDVRVHLPEVQVGRQVAPLRGEEDLEEARETARLHLEGNRG